MVATPSNIDNNSLVQTTLEWISDAGIKGLGVLPTPEQTAADYKHAGTCTEDAIDSLITWRIAQASGTGFISGLGGITTMPITIPAGLAASYALGANTAATVAHLKGYDVHTEQVKTLILLCLIGEAGESILKTAGIAVGNKICKNLIKQIPGKVLIEINKKVGFRLVTKAGEKGVVNLMKFVPLVGGVVGGTIDALFVKNCGEAAKKIF